MQSEVEKHALFFCKKYLFCSVSSPLIFKKEFFSIYFISILR
ncbi:hypothetical protein GbCGDNIH6_8305 [Granulibacter bethesdensis]|nr:hypothetical protein GbCGDNIH6_8305 [Granulibacter bethesdensis]